LVVNRREFITLLGGAAVWPLAASAQRQTAKLPTIGYLGPTSPENKGRNTSAFLQRLRELGWSEDRTVAIEHRWAQGRPERVAEIAAEFVRLKVDVIVTTSSRQIGARFARSAVLFSEKCRFRDELTVARGGAGQIVLNSSRQRPAGHG
jgi:putative ABC transport system substrate-binding protein